MKKVKIFIAVLIITLALGLFFGKDILNFYSKFAPDLTLKLPEIEQEIAEPIEKEVTKQFSLPSPLRVEKKYSAPQESQELAELTKDGALKQTNIQRKAYGLPLLKENAKLDASAREKARDMFEKQYFAHYSPLGTDVEDLITSVEYDFIAIGENLALGNFQNDKSLVQGWMDSPGHRANILNAGYQEIGVAVAKGIFEGKSTWIAVQHFGLPLSACSQPDLSFETAISENQARISELQKELLSLRTEIQKIIPKRGAEYIKNIEQYNALVSQYNALVEENKILISQYNSQVNLFNRCVAEFTK